MEAMTPISSATVVGAAQGSYVLSGAVGAGGVGGAGSSSGSVAPVREAFIAAIEPLMSGTCD